MNGHYQNITPEDIGIADTWNGVSIKPETSSLTIAASSVWVYTHITQITCWFIYRTSNTPCRNVYAPHGTDFTVRRYQIGQLYPHTQKREGPLSLYILVGKESL